jgi:RNA polymerase sigma-70 factor (ECF subfamily)
MPSMDEDREGFVKELTGAQASLWAYVLALHPDPVSAQDILQQTNLTLWRKATEFQPGTRFFAWASKAAYFHVLTYRRGMRRDRLVFNDEVFAYLAERQADRMDERSPGERASALRGCLEKLPPQSRRLLESRYAPGGSVQDLARSDGRSVAGLSQLLYRIRETLQQCIESALAAGGAS